MDRISRQDFELLFRAGIHGDRDEIFALIAKAVELEPGKRALLAEEPDFASLRDDARFQALIAADGQE